MMLRSKKSSPPLSCLLCQVALGIIAALVGVYKAHVLSSGLTFGTSSGSLSLAEVPNVSPEERTCGTSSGSLSLAALAFNLFLVKKVLESCPCTWGK